MADLHIRNQCFNCGQNLEKPISFCPHCGAPLPLAGSLFKIAGRAFTALFYGTCALICGSVGACATLGGVMGNSGDVFFGGLILLILAGFCVRALRTISIYK